MTTRIMSLTDSSNFDDFYDFADAIGERFNQSFHESWDSLASAIKKLYGKTSDKLEDEIPLPVAQKYVNELQEVHQRVQFEAKGTQKKLNAIRKRAAAAAEDEARCLDAELVIARRQKLKDLYASDYDRYQVELEAMGLSLNFE